MRRQEEPKSAPPEPASLVCARVGWEQTHREMLPAILLLHHLRRRGIESRLEHVRGFGEPSGRRDVVLMPFYYDQHDLQRYLYRIGLHQTWVINLCYEQMHTNLARGFLLPDGEFARDQMLHCTWGPRFRQLLLAHGIPDERIRTTGNPRFDLYTRPSLLKSRADLAARYGLDADKPWVLIPSSFNLAYVSATLRERFYRRKYLISQELVDMTVRARDAFLELLGVLAKRFPELEIILRVHPAGYESRHVYDGPARSRPNLHAIGDFDLANWIRQAALVIAWNSTSSMEAMVAGTPVICFEPDPYGERFEYDVFRIVPAFAQMDDVVDVVARLPDFSELPYDWERFERWYLHRDGRNVERLADLVAEAAGDFEAFRVRDTRALGPDSRRRRRWARLGSRVPHGVRRGWHAVFGGKAPHPPPPTAALEHAVATLEPTPLDRFLL